MKPTEPDFSRQSFLGDDAEEILRDVRVTIVGLGGGGSHIGQQLAHLGVGHYCLIDSDLIEASNLNRLVTATQADVDAKMPKVEIVERTIKGIRPYANVTIAKNKWQEVDALIKDSDLIFGCVDGYNQRKQLERAARQFLVPYLDIGMDVHRLAEDEFAVAGQAILSLPGEWCMTCMGFLTEEKLREEARRYGDAGVNPQVVWSNGILASAAVGIFVQLFAPWSSNRSKYVYLEYNGNDQTLKHSRIPSKIAPARCPHFDGSEDIGDPFFTASK